MIQNCPICYEENTINDGPMNSDFITDCTHFLCVQCWQEIYKQGNGYVYSCPLCREDISEWIIQMYDDYADDSTNEESY